MGFFDAVYEGDIEKIKAFLDAGKSRDSHEAGIESSSDTIIDINCHEEGTGDTALHIAAGRGDITLVNELCSRGVDTKSTNASKETALHIAVEEKQFKIIPLLLQIDNTILDCQDSEGNTALHGAISLECWDVAHSLVRAGADLNIKNAKDRTALDWAIAKGHPNIIADAKPDLLEIVAAFKAFAVDSASVEKDALAAADAADGIIEKLEEAIGTLVAARTSSASTLDVTASFSSASVTEDDGVVVTGDSDSEW